MKIKEPYFNTMKDALSLLKAFAEDDVNSVFGSSDEISYDFKDEWLADIKVLMEIINKEQIKQNEN
jgi:subtilase family serine protease